MVLAADECRPGNGRFVLGSGVVPGWPDFKYIDALPIDSASQIQFATNVRWWTSTLKEIRDCLIAAFDFKFGQGHRFTFKVLPIAAPIHETNWDA